MATREALSLIERQEIALHPWVAFVVMPLFALANAGVPIAGTSINPTLTTGVVAAFVIGKPVGVVISSRLAVTLRLATRPDELSWGLLIAGSLLAGIGFTMALFIAEAAFHTDLLSSVKLGILSASAISAVVGMAALTWLTARRVA